MAWQPGKSYYEDRVEEALIRLSGASPLCSDYRYNRSTWFSGRLRYDFVLGSRPRFDPSCGFYSFPNNVQLIEVHGEQHYRLDYSGNDAIKKRLAIDHGCPLLVIPYWEAYRLSDELLELISSFVRAGDMPDRKKDPIAS